MASMRTVPRTTATSTTVLVCELELLAALDRTVPVDVLLALGVVLT